MTFVMKMILYQIFKYALIPDLQHDCKVLGHMINKSLEEGRRGLQLAVIFSSTF